jgi:Protein kinase domain/Sulfatase-modifying factor enzyme 1
LHANQVLHRDVKPANILLSSGHARLADFGLARLIMEEGADLGATLIGTPLYMSPEVWEHKVGPSSDQYSLASTYVELRLGRPLFEADSQMEVMKKHLTMRPDLEPLPAAEQRALQRALAKNGNERYRTCVEFVSELQAAVIGETRPGRRGPTRRRVVVLGGLLCLAGGAAVAGLSWSGFQFKLVAPPPTMVPPNCEPAAGATEVFVAEEGVKYWNRIVRTLPDKAALPSGMACSFVLVPHHAEQRLPSFYILENKVWNELFAEFNNHYMQEHPDLVDSEKWPMDWADRGAEKGHGDDMPAASYPRHPVMRVGFHQAEEFAQWLGGSLPSPEQWDAAAGLYSASAKKSGAVGPFRGDWTGSPRPKIAVDPGGAGTSPVGERDDDVSPFLCRDMAGNGAEWTSQVTSGGYSTVTLRGRDYHKERPLFYSDLLAENSPEIEKEDPYYTSDHIGFRVVLAPTARAASPSGSDKGSREGGN